MSKCKHVVGVTFLTLSAVLLSFTTSSKAAFLSGGGDNLGDHSATENVKLNTFWLSGDGGNEGIYINSVGNIGIGTTDTDTKLTIATSTINTINVRGGYIIGLNSTPSDSSHAVPLGYLQDNYAPSGTAPGGVGAGIIGQTLRHDGTSWVANSVLFNNGANIGIGTSNPGAALDIVATGGTLLRASFGGSSQLIVGTGTGWTTLQIANANYDHIFSTRTNAGASAERLRIAGGSAIDNITISNSNLNVNSGQLYIQQSSGNVGIGTTSPVSKLQITVSDTGADDYIILEDTSTSFNAPTGAPTIKTFGSISRLSTNDGGLFIKGYTDSTSQSALRMVAMGVDSATSPYFSFAAYKSGGGSINNEAQLLSIMNGPSSPTLTILGNGNVGIGTTGPTVKLTIASSTADAVNVRGGFVAGLNLIPLRDDHAVPLGYLEDNYLASSSAVTSLWSGTVGGNIWNANSGNVGIGTTTPAYKLDVQSTTGVIRAKSTTGTNYALMQVSNTGGDFYWGINNSVGTGMLTTGGAAYDRVINTNSTYPLKFATNNAVAMTILNGGNVGIGTTNPGHLFQTSGSSQIILDAAGFYNTYAYGAGNTSETRINLGKIESGGLQSMGAISARPTYPTSSAEGILQFYTRAASTLEARMTILNTGNVGIGTTNPGAKLEISVPTSATNLFKLSNYDNDTSYVLANWIDENANTSFSATTIGDNTGALNWYFNGNVGIGTTNPTKKLEVGGADPSLSIWASNSGTAELLIGESTGGGYGLNYIWDGWYTYTMNSKYAGANTAIYQVDTRNNYLTINTNVGIGTTNPGAKLEVFGSVFGKKFITLSPVYIATTTSLFITDNNGQLASEDSLAIIRGFNYNSDSNSNLLVVGTAGPSNWERFVVKHSGNVIVNTGNVGIGTTNPAGALEIKRSSAGVFPKMRFSATDITLPDYSSSASISDVSLTNTFGQIRNRLSGFGAQAGGLLVQGFTGSGINNEFPVHLIGTHGGTSPTTAAVTIGGQKWNGATNRTALSGNEIVLDIENNYTVGETAPLLRILGSGNVGIGATDPNVKLTFASSTANTINVRGGHIIGLSSTPSDPSHAVPLVYLQNNYAPIGGSSQWTTSGTHIYNNNSGNVGIGTTTPIAPLHLYKSVNSIASSLIIENANPSGVLGDAFMTLKTRSSNFSLAVNDDTNFFTIVDEALSWPTKARLLIDGNGNVGVGTTVPKDKLQIGYSTTIGQTANTTSGSTNFARNLYFDGTDYRYINTDEASLSQMSANGDFIWYTFTSGTAGAVANSNASERMRILATNGNVGIGTTNPVYKLEVVGASGIGAAAFVNNSDINLKSNIKKIDNALEKIKALEGVYFDWKADGSSSVGLIAQDVEKIFPELVMGKEGQKGVQYSNLVAPLIEAVKEQQLQIDDLRKTSNLRVTGFGANYSPFTGSHEVVLSKDFPSTFRKGMIVSVIGDAKKIYNNELKITSTLATVKLSITKEDKAVYGTIESKMPENSLYRTSSEERLAVVNTLGEGKVLVTNMNGEIEIGDYITSSDIPGYGMRQTDDILRNYTVAKAIEKLDWNKVTETIKWQGNTYKVYLLDVVYISH